jgi:farnesyl-diphosphate farnesyltransferase
MSGRSVDVDEERMRHLLRGHARTFALTLRLLPHRLRESLGLAYLLARTSDTLADSGQIPRERRLAMLADLAEALSKDRPDAWRPRVETGELGAGDDELVRALPQLLVSLEENPDRREVIALWRSIVEGQNFDLTRFPSEAPLRFEELDRYCGLVAGSVGETWTTLMAKHAPQTLRHPQVEMMRLGFEYGKGLQLLNILRDRSADRAMGRLYVEERELQAKVDLSEQWLRSGEKYLQGLRPGKILMATALPFDLAMHTLGKIRQSPEESRIRLPRIMVRWIVIRGMASLCLPRRMNPAS